MERKRMKGERTLDVDGVAWGYMIGSKNTVLVHPDGRKQTVPHNELMGMGWHDIEHDMSKGNFSIKPGDVRNYIDKLAQQPA